MIPLALAACLSPERDPPARPDLLLVVVDTLRADALGAYGHARPTSFTFDALAREGLLFERAYAHASWTLPAFASLLTGLLPHEHRVGRDPWQEDAFGRLDASVVTLAEALSQAGYATGAIVNNTFLAPEFGLDQGFDRYDYAGAATLDHRPARAAAQAAARWLEAQEDPAFLLVHLFEPHLSYAPPPASAGAFTAALGPAPVPVPFAGGRANAIKSGEWRLSPAEQAYVRALYDEEVLAVDQALAALLAGLGERRRSTIIAFTADHGEELWDHGGFEHGHTLLGAVTRVPLALAGPGIEPGRSRTPVGHADLFRTLLALAGAAPPPGSGGEDLRDLAKTQDRAVISEGTRYGPPRVSIADGRRRLEIDQSSGEATLWAIGEDGAERPAPGEPAEPLRARLIARRGGLAPAPSASLRIPDQTAFEQLRTLGYIP